MDERLAKIDHLLRGIIADIRAGRYSEALAAAAEGRIQTNNCRLLLYHVRDEIARLFDGEEPEP